MRLAPQIPRPPVTLVSVARRTVLHQPASPWWIMRQVDPSRMKLRKSLNQNSTEYVHLHGSFAPVPLWCPIVRQEQLLQKQQTRNQLRIWEENDPVAAV